MQEQQLYDDEITIDLGKYIEILLRQWQLIVSATLIFAFTAGLVSVTNRVIQTKQYEARVLIASTKSSSAVSFGSSIQTMSESQLLASGSGAFGLIDRVARLESYVHMVKNPLVAQVVLSEVSDQLEEGELDIASILDMVEGNIAEKSDSIEIVVTYSDPVMAATIANLWGKAYVKQINEVYSEGGTGDSYLAIQQQTVEGKTAYDSAQEEYVAYVTDNQKDELNRKIDLITIYISTLNDARQKVFDEHAQDYLSDLSRAYSDARRVDELLVDAQDMRDQVQSGGEGAASSNALALTLLKAQVFAANTWEGDLQVQTNPAYLTPEQMVADMEGLIATLQARLTTQEEEIQTLSDALLNGEGFEFLDVPLDSTEDVLTFSIVDIPLDQKIQDLEQYVRDLQAQLAEEDDREQELLRARDLAWSTYSTLATKEAELEVAVQTKGTEVAFASPASISDKDTGTLSGFKNVMLATVVGLMLGVGAAYFIEFWWGYKGIDPKAITLGSLVGRKS